MSVLNKPLALALLCVGLCGAGWAQTAPVASAASAAAESKLYAVEIKTGPAWDAAKAPQDQPHFREHSANLQRLRQQGLLVLGARYADKGLVVLHAATEAEAHALMQADASIQAKVFAYELSEFRVFYSGSVAAPARRP